MTNETMFKFLKNLWLYNRPIAIIAAVVVAVVVLVWIDIYEDHHSWILWALAARHYTFFTSTFELRR